MRFPTAFLLPLLFALPVHAECRLPDGAEAARAAVIGSINAIRADQGLPAVTVAAPLQRAAQGHACDNAARGRMDHRSSDGRTMQDRVEAQGYVWRQLAENVAQGQRSAAEVVRGWLQSPPHRKNMMMPRAREAGVGLAVQADGTIHWVLNIARR